MAQPMPRRAKSGPGAVQWVLMGGGALLVLSGTFAVGVFAGRKWEHRVEAEQFTSEARKAAAAAPRRSGLTDTGAAPERPQDKLTFYQTLTAPVAPLPPSAMPSKNAKVEPPKPEPPKPRANAERPAAERPVTATPVSAPKPHAVAPPAAAPRADRPIERAALPRQPEPGRGGDWTVQVGVFKDRGQAESVRRPLAAAGYDAYLTTVSTADGQIRYKVRTGSFKSREDAARAAQRVRQEQALTPFVTTR